MKKISLEELNEILKKHEMWLNGEKGGVCFADVSTGKLHLTEIESKRLESEALSSHHHIELHLTGLRL